LYGRWPLAAPYIALAIKNQDCCPRVLRCRWLQVDCCVLMLLYSSQLCVHVLGVTRILVLHAHNGTAMLASVSGTAQRLTGLL
jgi:hypothetical protein